MYKNTAINTTKKFFMGCGVVSFALFAIVLCIGIFVDDDEQAVTDSQVSQSDGHTDSLKVQGVLEGDPYEELESLTGMTEVKAEVKSLANFIKIQKQREAQGMKTPAISYHCVFTGSPGTGKTTVARILARIYKDLGVLKKGHLVETDRSGLVAEYVGQTAVKTNHVCDSAIGGVLFIDEAYALTDEHSGGYGGEAIATLLKRMEDDRDSLVVIVAGYTNEMKRFINSNPGLQSRFNKYFHFPDYTGEQLMAIFDSMCGKNGYTLKDDTRAAAETFFAQLFENRGENFGNARDVRNLFEDMVVRQADRLAALDTAPDKDALMTIEPNDFLPPTQE